MSGRRPRGVLSVVGVPCRALGPHSDAPSAGIAMCPRALTHPQDPRLSLPRHDAGDGVHTVSECRQAVASATCRTLLASGHAGHGLQGWAPGGARRRVSLHTQLLTITQPQAGGTRPVLWNGTLHAIGNHSWFPRVDIKSTRNLVSSWVPL